MREMKSIYTCDRCGESSTFSNLDADKCAYELNSDGWRRLEIVNIFGEKPAPGAVRGIFGSVDLCRLCYTAFTAFIKIDYMDVGFSSKTDTTVGDDRWPSL